jgi:hypothetical protein
LGSKYTQSSTQGSYINKAPKLPARTDMKTAGTTCAAEKPALLALAVLVLVVALVVVEDEAVELAAFCWN